MKRTKSFLRLTGLLLGLTLGSEHTANAQGALDEARAMLGEGIIDEAIGVLEMHLEGEPEDAQGWALLAGAMERMWREAGGSFLALNDAREAWQRAIALEPFSVAHLHSAAALDLTLGEYESAAALGMRALGTASLGGGPAKDIAGEAPAGLRELIVRARIGAWQASEQDSNESWAADLSGVWSALRNARALEPSNSALALIEGTLLDDLGFPELAVESVFRSLESAPSDVALNQRLIDLHTANDIVERLPARYAALARTGVTGTKAWYAGYVDRLVGDEALRQRRDVQAREAYDRCMSWMDTTALLEPSYASGALGIRIQARVARARALILGNELKEAERELVSMLITHGEWRATPDGLGRTLMGATSSLANKLSARNQFGRAAGLARAVVGELPEDGAWWNNLGFFLREYGTQVEAGVATDRAKGDAHGIFLSSWNAYEKAVALLPDDAAVLNDAALIQVYHLRSQLEYAEELLNRAIQRGEAQLAELADPTPSERYPYALAVGDAYQNLGYLYYHVLDRPAESRPFWLASMATDSGDRSYFQVYIDAIDGVGEAVQERESGGFVGAPMDTDRVRRRLPWEDSLAGAAALAGSEHPVLIYNRREGVGTSILELDFIVGSERFEQHSLGARLLIADGLRHNFSDRTDDGRRLACTRWGSVTCAEHLAVSEDFDRWLLEEAGIEASEFEEGLWIWTPGDSGWRQLEDPYSILEEGEGWSEEPGGGPSPEALAEAARGGDPGPLAHDPRLAARLRAEELLHGDAADLSSSVAAALLEVASPASIRLLEPAIRQLLRPELTLRVLAESSGGLHPELLGAVEHTSRWSSDEVLRAVAQNLLELELPGFERRALAKRIVAGP